MGKLIDLTGQKFGRLIVIKRVENDNSGHVQWLCQCDCGEGTMVQGGNLKNSNTKSCGCLHTETITQHGHSSRSIISKIYRIWIQMIQRCTNPNVKNYKNYGGRGIKVCERWRQFENFLQDMGEKPSGLSVDRIDNNGDYCKENCKWSTRKEQNRNTRQNRLITINGITKPLAEWCEIYNLNYKTVCTRIYRGWTSEEALELVPRKKKK